jgi:CRISPR-associated endonuclease/helicase Cas3
MAAYAHTLPDQPPERWELLETHLKEVSELAGEFCEAFGAGDWGRLAGAWHDLGKYSNAFQERLHRVADPDTSEETKPGRVDHSTFGAQFAMEAAGNGKWSHLAQVLAFCIAGHHAGLADGTSSDGAGAGATLQARLERADIPAVSLPPGWTGPRTAQLKLPFAISRENAGFTLAFFTRMVFSALVDADRLCTERFCDPAQSQLRAQHKPAIAELRTALMTTLDRMQSGSEPTLVNRVRGEVRADCVEAALKAPGFFSLNVPTGGGKTLSSMAFALKHAEQHGLRRVVVAIPFTSIIEQTADVYRNVFEGVGSGALIEHHSNLDPQRTSTRHKLATENWDAPLIVTTNVQLYESLFAADTNRCRKLHRLARSVIILDEAQTMPVDLLAPTLAALKELVAHYGCTVVLCTATQPALEYDSKAFPVGLPKPGPIIRDEHRLFSALKRTRIERLGRLSDRDLATRLLSERQVLCIVNTRPHAAKLYDLLGSDRHTGDCFHLSTSMCAQHRREVLAIIRRRLAGGQPCRVISTQLIEAGVDIDLPVVYRAVAGFDSIAQAAGRCNREGRLAELGRVYVFDAESPPPPGTIRSAADCAAELFSSHPDPLHPDSIRAYFEHFYWHQGQHKWDRPGILPMLDLDVQRPQLTFRFRQVSQEYQIIRDEQCPILVPYNDEAKNLVDTFLKDQFDFSMLRTAQKYIVSVRENLLRQLETNRTIIPHESSGLCLLSNPAAYCSSKGLSTTAAGLDPSSLMY